MNLRRNNSTTADDGPGLARGPALILGAVLAGFGLVLFLKNGATPTDGFPDGTQQGDRFLGFETNGWTAWFTVTAGVLLLFGAAQHLLAKTMSLLVGLALGACAVIALIDGQDVLGLAAANGWTELGWAIAAVLLLFNTLIPRVRHKKDDHPHGRTVRTDGQRAAPGSVAASEHDGAPAHDGARAGTTATTPVTPAPSAGTGTRTEHVDER